MLNYIDELIIVLSGMPGIDLTCMMLIPIAYSDRHIPRLAAGIRAPCGLYYLVVHVSFVSYSEGNPTWKHNQFCPSLQW